MFAITTGDIEYHIKECGRCAVLKRVRRMGATERALLEKIRSIHFLGSIAA